MICCIFSRIIYGYWTLIPKTGCNYRFHLHYQHKNTRKVLISILTNDLNNFIYKLATHLNYNSGSHTRCRLSSSVDTREECWLRSRCTSQIRYRRRPWMSSSRSRFRYIWRDTICCSHKSKQNLCKPKWRTSCSFLDLLL